MPITVQTLSDAVARSHARIERLEDQLNAADALLGDGDTGSMLARVIEKMANSATNFDVNGKNGMLFVFPSWVNHSALTYSGNKLRYILSANSKVTVA